MGNLASTCCGNNHVREELTSKINNDEENDFQGVVTQVQPFYKGVVVFSAPPLEDLDNQDEETSQNKDNNQQIQQKNN